MDDNELADAKATFARWAEGNPHAADPLMAFLAAWSLSTEAVDHPGVDLEAKERLTIAAEKAVNILRDDPSVGPSVKLIIMLQDDNGDGGIEICGYRNSRDGLVDLFHHMRELFKAHGIDPDKILAPGVPKPPIPAAFKRPNGRTRS